jgi:hypothetical protein
MKLDSSQRPRHRPVDLVGQTVAINLALVPILLEATGMPFHLTIGWIEQQGKPVLEHLAFGVLHCMGPGSPASLGFSAHQTGPAKLGASAELRRAISTKCHD